MWLIVRELIVARSMSVRVYNSGELKEQMIEAYRQKLSQQDMMSKLLTCDVLCIDDLGKEKMTDAWKEMLFNVIDKRTLYHKPMIITTNYVGKSFSELFTDKNMADPVIRRLREFFVDISV
jgi:DNA replication protein DnaC